MIPELLPCGCENSVFAEITVIANIPAHHFNSPATFRKEIEDAAIDELVDDTFERIQLATGYTPQGDDVIHDPNCPTLQEP